VTKGFLSCPLSVDASQCNCNRRRTNLDHWNEELMKCDAGTSTVGAALRRAAKGAAGGKKLPRRGFSGSRPYSGPWSDRTIRRAQLLADKRQRFLMSSAVDAKSLTTWDWPLAERTLLALNGGVKDDVCRRFDRAGGEVVEALRCCHLVMARVAREQQILCGAWSEGFIDGGEAACQRLVLSGAMKRARALVQSETDAVLDELRAAVEARARRRPDSVPWDELRAALVDEGLSVEELRSELRRHSLLDGAQGDQGPLVARLTEAVELAAGWTW
jgi:hypothetical protein